MLGVEGCWNEMNKNEHHSGLIRRFFFNQKKRNLRSRGFSGEKVLQKEEKRKSLHDVLSLNIAINNTLKKKGKKAEEKTFSPFSSLYCHCQFPPAVNSFLS